MTVAGWFADVKWLHGCNFLEQKGFIAMHIRTWQERRPEQYLNNSTMPLGPQLELMQQEIDELRFAQSLVTGENLERETENIELKNLVVTCRQAFSEQLLLLNRLICANPEKTQAPEIQSVFFKIVAALILHSSDSMTVVSDE